MRLRPEQLDRHLEGGDLAPIYLISGDEPLQRLEAGDALRAAARKAGYTQREVLDVEPGFDWRRLFELSGNLSLFGDRRLIELRLSSTRIGTEGSKALVALCADLPPDTLFSVSAPRLDAAQLKSKWVKTIESRGVLLRIWPIDTARLPDWLLRRMHARGLQATPEAAALLAERVEGNLLAARQEIEKLLLLTGPGPLDAGRLVEAVADSARFDVFGLVDAALAGDAARALRVLDGLRAEGIAAPIVLWALTREIRLLAGVSAAMARGEEQGRLLAERRVLERRRGLLGQALRRIRLRQWRRLLQLCQSVDRAIKRGGREESWRLLGLLTAWLAGRPLAGRAVLLNALDRN